MYQKEYFVPKHTGTYAETLEAYGLAHLLTKIFEANSTKGPRVTIADSGTHYVVSAREPITEEMVRNTDYVEMFRYIKVEKDNSPDVPVSHIDYAAQKKKRKVFDQFITDRRKELNEKKLTKAEYKRRIDDYEDKPHPDLDVLSRLAFASCYNHVYMMARQGDFHTLLAAVLSKYSSQFAGDHTTAIIGNDSENENRKKRAKWLAIKVTALQLISPSQSKGTNSSRLFLNEHNPKIPWISQYLRFAGCYSGMIPRGVAKESKDTKVYVIEPTSFEYNRLKGVYDSFKPTLRGTHTLKLDIICLLKYCAELIRNSEEYKSKTFLRKWKPENSVAGFHLAYLKNMGNNPGVTNISFLALPVFIEINSFDDAESWLSILDEHLNIIESINDKDNSVTTMLLHYRQFLSGSMVSEFFKFNLAYNAWMIQQRERKNMYVKPFSLKLLKELFMATIDKKLAPILESPGFQSLADAIRNTTIKAQIAKGNGVKGRQYGLDIRYGLTQEIKRKCLRKSDFESFIWEFVADYGRQLGRNAEGGHQKFSAIRTNEIEDFVKMLDDNEDQIEVIAKMLVAYGYALEEKKSNKQ